MSLDIYTVLACCILYFLIPVIHNYPRLRKGGAEWALGDRAVDPEMPEWVGRLVRAHRNFAEWLPMFGILVALSHVTHSNSEITVFAAIIYFVARVIYTYVYAIGSRLRSPVWYLSTFCLAAIMIEIVRVGTTTAVG